MAPAAALISADAARPGRPLIAQPFRPSLWAEREEAGIAAEPRPPPRACHFGSEAAGPPGRTEQKACHRRRGWRRPAGSRRRGRGIGNAKSSSAPGWRRRRPIAGSRCAVGGCPPSSLGERRRRRGRHQNARRAAVEHLISPAVRREERENPRFPPSSTGRLVTPRGYRHRYHRELTGAGTTGPAPPPSPALKIFVVGATARVGDGAAGREAGQRGLRAPSPMELAMAPRAHAEAYAQRAGRGRGAVAGPLLLRRDRWRRCEGPGRPPAAQGHRPPQHLRRRLGEAANKAGRADGRRKELPADREENEAEKRREGLPGRLATVPRR